MILFLRDRNTYNEILLGSSYETVDIENIIETIIDTSDNPKLELVIRNETEEENGNAI